MYSYYTMLQCGVFHRSEKKGRLLCDVKLNCHTFSFSYDDAEILAGQGTAALEVIEQMDRLGENIDAVVIPVGGGGLLAGMATTLKHLAPEVRVIVSRQ